MSEARRSIELQGQPGWVARRFLHLITGLFFFLLAVGYLYNAFLIRVPPIGDALGPRLFPMALGGLLLFFSTVFLGQLVFAAKQEDDSHDLRAQRSAWRIFGLLGLYVLVFGYIGYLASTAVFVFVALRLMGFRGWLINLVTALIMAGAFYLVFRLWLGVPLPSLAF